jgi:hypothetical protein
VTVSSCYQLHQLLRLFLARLGCSVQYKKQAVNQSGCRFLSYLKLQFVFAIALIF